MTDRKYSVAEIDIMRLCLRTIGSDGWGGEPLERRVEDQLRTYMLNGTEPEELTALADERLAKQRRAWLEKAAHNRAQGERFALRKLFGLENGASLYFLQSNGIWHFGGGY